MRNATGSESIVDNLRAPLKHASRPTAAIARKAERRCALRSHAVPAEPIPPLDVERPPLPGRLRCTPARPDRHSGRDLDPEQEALLPDSVGFALLVVLQIQP